MPNTDTLREYKGDFVFLKGCQEFLNKEIESYENTPTDRERFTEGYYSHMPNGCSVRVMLPQGADIVRGLKELSLRGECELYFVGFIGYTREGVPEGLKKRMWKMDRLLREELARHEDIVCYLSAERSPGGSWGNFVVFRHPRAVEKWRHAAIHDRAVMDISPAYYTHVRIHRGTLQNGLHSEKFGVGRTLFLCYDNEQCKIKNRYVKTWGKGSCPQLDLCYALS